MTPLRLFVVSVCFMALSSAAEADHRTGELSAAGHHPGWRGDVRYFDFGYWRGGHWRNGTYGSRLGWWWIVGPDWYWYPEPVYPYPDPFLPPGAAPGFWYWCDYYQQYYPYVGTCPSGWRAVPAQ